MRIQLVFHTPVGTFYSQKEEAPDGAIQVAGEYANLLTKMHSNAITVPIGGNDSMIISGNVLKQSVIYVREVA